MSELRTTPGPWKVTEDSWSEPAYGIESFEGEIIVSYGGSDQDGVGGDNENQKRDNANLLAAAPAFAKVWSMVPYEIRQGIFDALSKPDTEWVEESIMNANGE